MPRVHTGEVLAIMDSGAYFTAMESSFGFARPAIVSVNQSTHRLVRRTEIFTDMISRDLPVQEKVMSKLYESKNEKN
jgi:diaminopimelate decarboxylase